MSDQMTEDQIAGMSDDELMSMVSAPSLSGSPEPAPAEPADPAEPAEPAAPQEPQEPQEPPAEPNEPAEPEDPSNILATGDDDEPPAKAPAKAEKAAEPAADPADPAKPAADPAAEPATPAPAAAEAPLDYKALYEKLMSPLRANGKDIQLKDADELLVLAQKGANYTKKMQALAPNLKLMRMLENHDLLDEGKLGFLIDLSRKDPAAIQKFMRESGVDPMDIDTSAEPSYKPGYNPVSDAEMRFTTTLEEVGSTPAGKEMILTANNTWDPKSKDALWDEPEILHVLTKQKQDGLYDQIANEVERRRILGTIGSSVPFLQAYYAVGQELTQSGAPAPAVPATGADTGGQPPAPTPGRVVETRPAMRKPDATNERALAASPSKSVAPKQVAADFNPLALSDEDFEKNAELARRL